MGRNWGAPVTLDTWWAVTRWQIAKETGWKLEYIEALSFEDIWEYLSIQTAASIRKVGT